MFVEVGSALMRVRDGRKYKPAYNTFEDYCRERWGFGRNYANKVIQAAGAVIDMGTTVPTESISERQARELAAIKDPAERADVWAKAVEQHGPQDRPQVLGVESPEIASPEPL